jgi:zinc/manganese transport system ATP-binding protein
MGSASSERPTGRSDAPGRVGGGSVASTAVVEARHAAVSFGTRLVWSDATFAIEPGEFVAVLGPNGAGKSTLARALLGLVPLSAGELRVLGLAPRRGNPAIGYVPQRRPVDRELRLAGTEFVRLGWEGHRWGVGLPGRRARDVSGRVERAIAAVGAESYADGPIGTMSGGEIQRLLLAQAVVGEPRLLILDEPLASLDVRNQLAVAQLVSELARSRGIAVMLIAHDVNPLLPVVDRVLYVARGQLAIGVPREVITSERLSALYDATVEVLRDSRGRLFVVGLEDEATHPHDLDHVDLERSPERR